MNLCTNAAQAMDGRGTIEIALESIAVGRERALSHGSLTPGPYIRLAVRDAGHGMDAADHAADLRAVLHHQACRRRHRPRPADGARHRDAARRHAERGELSRCRQPFEAIWPSTTPPPDDAGFDRMSTKPGTRRNGPFGRRRGPARAARRGDARRARLRAGRLTSGAGCPFGFRADPERFDLALLDEMMPEITGSELAAAMHEIRSDLPIVLMTGRRSAVPAHRLTAAGIGEVLAKPLRSASLADCLTRHLSAPRRVPAALGR